MSSPRTSNHSEKMKEGKEWHFTFGKCKIPFPLQRVRCWASQTASEKTFFLSPHTIGLGTIESITEDG